MYSEIIFALEVITVFVIGMCLGSFATALSYRMPRGISMISPKKKLDKEKISRSHCPSCNHVLGILDLFPVFSWLFSGGKCRYCKKKISIRYPVIELSTALLCLIFFLIFPLDYRLIPLFLMSFIMVAIIAIDFEFQIIPNRLNLSLFILGLIMLLIEACYSGEFVYYLKDTGKYALISALTFGIGSFLLRAIFMKIMKREPMGLGDVKFFFVAGLWIGNLSSPMFLLISGLSGIFISLFWKKITGREEFPFGPSLILAFLICLIFDGGVFYKMGM